mgnify:CR=1 FL=1
MGVLTLMYHQGIHHFVKKVFKTGVIKTLQGTKCSLRPFSKEDIPHLMKFMGDIKPRETLRNVLPVTEGHVKRMIEIMERCPYPTSIIFGIETDGKLIGVTSLDKINWISRNAYISIAIYDTNFWGKGIGEEATRLLLEYAFEYLNLYKINLEVYEYNERAIKLYKKIGFKEEGRLKENNLRHGKHRDVIIMGMTAREYFGGK